MNSVKIRNMLSAKKLFILIAAGILMMHTPCVSAISSSQRKIFNYSIPYYNDCYSGGGSGGGAGGVSGGTGDYSGEDVLKFAGFSVGSCPSPASAAKRMFSSCCSRKDSLSAFICSRFISISKSMLGDFSQPVFLPSR